MVHILKTGKDPKENPLIYVEVELRGLGWTGDKQTGIIDKEDFIEFYGKNNYKDLMKDGVVSETIGRDKRMRAKVLPQDNSLWRKLPNALK